MPLTRWEQFYLDDERVMSTPASHCVRKAVDEFSRCDAQLILDVACGVGRDSFYLGENGFRVIGVDAAESGLMIANCLKRKNQQNGIFVRADARQLPFTDASVDGVYCFGLLHEFTEDTRNQDVNGVMNEIYRVLKSSGTLILSVLSGEPEKGLPHVYLFTEQEFDAASRSFHRVRRIEYSDVGCTGRDDYRVWYGVFKK